MREPDSIDDHRGIASFGWVRVHLPRASARRDAYYLSSPLLAADDLRRVAEDITAAIDWYERRQADSEEGDAS